MTRRVKVNIRDHAHEDRQPVNRSRRHDADAGGDPDVLAAKAALRAEVWTALTSARRPPGTS
jgi:hypothetical protein